MRKVMSLMAILAVVSVFMLTGCEKGQAPAPKSEQSTGTSTSSTGTTSSAPTATAPAKTHAGC